MSNLERRVVALEKSKQTESDGRDSGMLQFMEFMCERQGWEFEREMVPPGYTVKDLLNEISSKPHNLPIEHHRQHAESDD